MTTKHITQAIRSISRAAVVATIALSALACAHPPSPTTTILDPATGAQTRMSTTRDADGSVARIVIERSGVFEGACERIERSHYEYGARGQLREFRAEEQLCGIVSARVTQRFDADGEVRSVFAQRDRDGDGVFDDQQWTREPVLEDPTQADATLLAVEARR